MDNSVLGRVRVDQQAVRTQRLVGAIMNHNESSCGAREARQGKIPLQAARLKNLSKGCWVVELEA